MLLVAGQSNPWMNACVIQNFRQAMGKIYCFSLARCKLEDQGRGMDSDAHANGGEWGLDSNLNASE